MDKAIMSFYTKLDTTKEDTILNRGIIKEESSEDK